MRILIACEYSATVRDAFRSLGHDAWSCDIIPTEGDQAYHIQGDVIDILNDGWDMMIAHPPCTHLSVSGARWFTEGKKPMYLRDQAIEFVKVLMNAPIEKIAIENPRSVISSMIRSADQTIQPYMFGHPEMKTTCLWLKNLPKLKETENVYDYMMTLPDQEKYRIWRMSPGKNRSYERSRTYPGIAKAMAQQWGA